MTLTRLGKEQPADYYDFVYSKRRARKRYQCHYKKSIQFGIWRIAMSYIKSLKLTNPKILEVACGTGQFAHYLQDEKFTNYVGFDFSKTALRQARGKSKQKLLYDNARNKSLYTDDIDIIIAIEFLEHVNDDLEIINLFPSRSNVIFSVPIGGGSSHVRRFENEEAINDRYKDDIDITQIRRYGDDHIWFVCKGVKR